MAKEALRDIQHEIADIRNAVTEAVQAIENRQAGEDVLNFAGQMDSVNLKLVTWCIFCNE